MSAEWSEDDRVFMEHALLVAERGRGKVSPNPLWGVCSSRTAWSSPKDGTTIWVDCTPNKWPSMMRRKRAFAQRLDRFDLEPCNHFGAHRPARKRSCGLVSAR